MSGRRAFRLTRRGRVGLVVMSLAVLTAFWMLHSRKLDLVHVVVVNAVIQKAPPGYPGDRISAAFEEARSEAVRRHQEAEYLEQLLSLSQRLEKVQSLAASELDEMLLEMLPPDS